MAENTDATEELDDDDGDDEPKKVAKKPGLVGRIIGPILGLSRVLGFLNPLKILKLPRKLQFAAVGGVLVLVLGAGGALYLLPSAEPPVAHEGEGEGEGDGAAKRAAIRLPTDQTTFFEVPEIIVNIQTPDGTPAYLKLAITLEIDQPQAGTIIEPVLPRVIDQFQTYLRELRIEDIRGSAGVMRMKEELLRRVNLALAPLPVRDVLLKEMIVQ